MELGKSMRMGHPGLVGLPIFLTAVFCFALVMAHPDNGNKVTDTRSVTAKKVSRASNASLKAKPKSKKRPSSSHQAKVSQTKVAQPVRTPYQVHVTKGNGIAPAETGNPQEVNQHYPPEDKIQEVKETLDNTAGDLLN